MSTPSSEQGQPAGEFVSVRLPVLSTAAVFPAGGVLLVAVAALTGMHDWGFAISTAIGGTLGYGVALASGISPALRASKQDCSLVDRRTIELRSPAASLAPAPIVLLAMSLYFALGPQDLATPGAIVLGVGCVSWFEVRAVRRWELEHDALLASAVRPRRERLRHPFRLPRIIGVRIQGSDPLR